MLFIFMCLSSWKLSSHSVWLRWGRRAMWSLWASSSWPPPSSRHSPGTIPGRCCQRCRTFWAASPPSACSTCSWSRPRPGILSILIALALTPVSRACCYFVFIRCFRYVERVSEVLRQKMKQADILVLKSTTMVEKRQEALEEQSRLEPRIDLLAGCTRELQKLVLIYIFQFGYVYI